MQDAFAHCEGLVRAADRDRFIASLFAPSAQRGALLALSAFTIEAARVRDRVTSPLPGEIRLQWWRDVLAGARPGEVEASPVAAALLATIGRYRLPIRPLLDLIDAHAFDLYDEPMQDLAALEAYGAATAAGPLALAVRILAEGGEPDVGGLVRDAGIAQAMTGLMRAFPAHAARRQLYLPLDVLRPHGVPAEEIFAGRAAPALRAVLAEMRARARERFAAAQVRAGDLPGPLQPALLPVALVPAWLDRMDRADDPYRAPEIPAWRRQWLLWRAARRPGGL